MTGLPCVGLPLGQRHDADAVTAYVAVHSAAIPRAQLDVYVAYWVCGQSEAQIAELQGMPRDTVHQRIARLRRRVRRWAEQRAR